MPNLPAPEDYGARAPNPSRDITRVTPADTGAVLSTLGRQLSQMVEEETLKLDNLAVQNALVDLSYKDTELTMGENGYLKQPLKSYTSGEVLKKYPTQYQEAIDNIAKGINSPRAREVFVTKARDDMSRFNRSLVGHNSTHIEKAMDVSDAAVREAAKNKLASLPSLLGLQQAITTVDETWVRTANRYENATLTLMREADVRSLAGVTFDALVQADAYTEAEAVLKEYGKVMGDKLAGMKNRLEAKQSFTVGSRLANEAMALPDGARNEFIRKATEEKPGVYKVADAVLKDLEQGEKDGHIAARGQVYATFIANPTRASKAAVLSSPEFQRLPKEHQGVLEENMRRELEHQEDRAWTSRSRANAGRLSATERAALEATDPQRLELFHALINDPGLGSKPAGYAQGYLGQLGRELTGKLAAEYQRARTGRQKYSIASEVIKGSAPPALFQPANRGKLNAYLGIVESLTQDFLARNPDRLPSMVDEIDILQKAGQRYVLDIPWRVDKEARAYELKPMPRDFIDAARNAAKRAGMPDPSRAQLLDSWAKQKEAYP